MDAEMAIASPHWRATEAGNRVLAESGSAVDAAIAAAAVLTVVYPHMVTLGGDAFALLGDADGAIIAANGSGAYAADASVDEVRRRNDGRMPTYGVDTITLPGGVAAWRDMHARAGRLPWPELFTEAIELARDGMEVAGALARDLDALRDKLVQDPGIREVFFDEDGVPASEGDHIRQPRLAESLSRIAEEGAEALYGGAVGSRLIEGLAARGSALTLEDLRRHRTEFVEPISVSYRGHEVVTTPPNSQGFVLLQMLEVLTDLGLTDALGSPRADRLARLFAIGNRQRVQHLGDPRATEVDVAGLLARPRIDEILSGLESTPDAGPRDPRPTGDTIAIVATDRFGASISLIQSIFFAFGSMVLEPTTGILLQNRGSSFSLEPGRTSTLRPGARPPHTLMPVMLRKDDEIVGVLGTMGGPSQAQIHAQLIQRLINGDDPQDVVSATRWVVGDYGDGPGDTVLVEERCAPDLRRDLAASGLPLVVGSEWDDRVGHSQVIMRAPGPIRVGTDPRADAKAKR